MPCPPLPTPAPPPPAVQVLPPLLQELRSEELQPLLLPIVLKLVECQARAGWGIGRGF